jgi:hypothetical protein
VPHYYALMRAGYVLHSHECLERRVVGKCCSNVLRSLRAYGVPLKAVRTCVCEKNDTAHVRSSRCAIPYIQPRANARMRAGYVVHSLECSERRVVGKSCSNVLRSLIAYGVSLKAVRTCVCEKTIQHMCVARCATPYIQPRARSYAPMHTCAPVYQIQNRVHALDATTREHPMQ